MCIESSLSFWIREREKVANFELARVLTFYKILIIHKTKLRRRASNVAQHLPKHPDVLFNRRVGFPVV
jgi:hypothetical protein